MNGTEILRYKQSDIQLCVNLLNGMTVSGVANAEKVAVIARCLMEPLPEEKKEGDDAGCKEE